MSSYVVTTDFSAKDSLPTGNPGKVIKGSEHTTEFANIATAINSKADAASPTLSGTIAISAGGVVTVNGASLSDVELSYLDGVTSAIQTQISAKAPSASPTFTGTPVAPTQTLADNSTKLATTAYVDLTAFATAAPFLLTPVVTADSRTTANGELNYVTAASKTITFPASPGAGNIVAIRNDAAVVTTVADGNGNTIQGVATITIDIDEITFTFMFINSTYGWVIL